MAARKKTSNKSAFNKVDYKEIVWVINNLPDDLLDDHDNNPQSAEDLFGMLDQLVEDGFSISVKWDTYSDCPMVSAVCYNADATNASLGISARGDSFSDAFSIVCYKYFVMAQRDLRPFAEKMPKRGNRG